MANLLFSWFISSVIARKVAGVRSGRGTFVGIAWRSQGSQRESALNSIRQCTQQTLPVLGNYIYYLYIISMGLLYFIIRLTWLLPSRNNSQPCFRGVFASSSFGAEGIFFLFLILILILFRFSVYVFVYFPCSPKAFHLHTLRHKTFLSGSPTSSQRNASSSPSGLYLDRVNSRALTTECLCSDVSGCSMRYLHTKMPMYSVY